MPQKPLSGVNILDLSQIMAGPYCSLLLADMGANVIKVEKPNGGDDTRRMGPPFINGESAAFLGVYRYKRSIVIDFKNPDGVKLIKQLSKKCDVLIQNFRPGTLQKMGMGYEDIKAENPSIIYCTISGFGSTGPYKDRAGFDLVTQGMSGLMSITGSDKNTPTKIGVPITDLNSGMYAAYGILNAYIHKLKTNEGQHVDVSLLESGIAYTFWESAEFFATGSTPQPMGTAHRLNAPYQAFKTLDGYVNVGAANQRNWERLCDAIQRSDLLNNPLFTDNSLRMKNIRELVDEIQKTILSKSTNDWLDIFEAFGVPSGPILNIQEVFENEQVISRDMMIKTAHPIAGEISNIGIPVKLSETPGEIYKSAPVLGENTIEILEEFDFSKKDIDDLLNNGAVVSNLND